MEVELEGKKIRMVRDVKTKIEPEKLAKQKIPGREQTQGRGMT